jgi:hypothetical protein
MTVYRGCRRRAASLARAFFTASGRVGQQGDAEQKAVVGSVAALQVTKNPRAVLLIGNLGEGDDGFDARCEFQRRPGGGTELLCTRTTN